MHVLNRHEQEITSQKEGHEVQVEQLRQQVAQLREVGIAVLPLCACACMCVCVFVCVLQHNAGFATILGCNIVGAFAAVLVTCRTCWFVCFDYAHHAGLAAHV